MEAKKEKRREIEGQRKREREKGRIIYRYGDK